jgi:hypothetical protein
MQIAFRLMTGMAIGLEFTPVTGVYLHLYLGIVEVVFFNEDEIEENE